MPLARSARALPPPCRSAIDSYRPAVPWRRGNRSPKRRPISACRRRSPVRRPIAARRKRSACPFAFPSCQSILSSDKIGEIVEISAPECESAFRLRAWEAAASLSLHGRVQLLDDPELGLAPSPRIDDAPGGIAAETAAGHVVHFLAEVLARPNRGRFPGTYWARRTYRRPTPRSASLAPPCFRRTCAYTPIIGST